MSIEELRNKRLEQIKTQQNEEQQFAAQMQQLEMLFRKHATPNALQRYGNLKVGHPKKALQALVIFAQLIQAGKVTEISDEVLKSVLLKMNEKKEFNIRRR